MIRYRRTLWAILSAALVLLATPGLQAGGEIYGTIQTTDGSTLRGPIRWDRNEVFWDDLLNATRKEPIKKDKDKREFSMTIFGVRLGGEPPEFTYHSMAIPFGHLRSIEPLSAREARLSLKGGTDVVVSSGSTDLGSNMRELIIDDQEKGAVELRWNAIERVEFGQGEGPGRDAERLYGKVVTAEETEIEGYLVFNNNVSLAGDKLTGEAEGKEREFRLGDFSSLEPKGSSKARCKLRQDQAILELRDLTVIGDRKVAVSPGGVGTVEVDWDDIQRIDFAKPPASPRYEAFDGGRRLSGTVHTRAGKSLSGEIVWDRDETHTYDELDGEVGDDLEYAIPFANILTIKRKSSRASEIVLTNGSSLELDGTNDVNDDNRGIIVHLASGDTRELDWDEIDRVEFHHPGRTASHPTPAEAGSQN